MTRPSRFVPVLIGFLIAATVVIHALGAFLAPTALWGAHFYAFFHPLVFSISTLLLITSCLYIAYKHNHTGRLQVLRRSHPVVLPAVLTATATAFLWIARTRHTYLGDGNVLAQSLPAGQTHHPFQPLTMLIQEWLYRATGPLFGAGERSADLVARDAVAFGSVAAGAAFFAFAWMLARELVMLAQRAFAARASEADAQNDPGIGYGTTLIVWLVIASQGYMQLFFGYVENYTFYTAGVALYLWLALRYLRGVGSLILPGAALVLNLALHLSSAILIPSFGFLVIAAVLQAERRRSAIRDALFTLALVIALRQVFAAIEPGYDIIATLWDTSGVALTREQESVPGYMLSWMHIRDFFNEQLLIGPLGLLLFLPALAFLPGARGTRGTSIFLGIAGATYLATSWLAGDSNLGYARNWDLLAAGGLVFTVAGLGVLFARGVRVMWRPLLACALLVSIYHTAPWIATNVSEGPSLARLETLPLDRGRREVLVGKWHAERGDLEQATMWYQRAVRIFPANNNAQYLLGLTYFETGDLDRAAHHFEAAVNLRPRKLLFRLWLIDVLTALGEYERAIPHLTHAIEADPGNGRVWFIYADALEQTGRRDEAHRAFERALPVFEERWRDDKRDFEANYQYGQLLYRMKDYDTALARFEDALASRPQNDGAMAYAGYTLANLGRVDEARELFTQCLALNPDHPSANDIRAWMNKVSSADS